MAAEQASLNWTGIVEIEDNDSRGGIQTGPPKSGPSERAPDLARRAADGLVNAVLCMDALIIDEEGDRVRFRVCAQLKSCSINPSTLEQLADEVTAQARRFDPEIGEEAIRLFIETDHGPYQPVHGQPLLTSSELIELMRERDNGG